MSSFTIAAAQMAIKLDYYGISVKEDNVVIYEGVATKVPIQTNRKKSIAILNKLIKTERQKRFNDSQGRLL